MRQLRLVSIILITTALALSGLLPNVVPGVKQAYAAPNAKIAIDPPSVFISGRISGQVTFEVNVTNAPAINGFTAAVTYNIQVLQPVSPIDYSNNVLTTALCGSPPAPCQPTVVRNCVAGQGPACGRDDGPGIVGLGLLLLGTTTPATVNGKLYSITFNILGSGFSEIHILSATITNGESQSAIPSDTFDGYFTNIACPASSSTPCTPPIVNFTVSPSPADIVASGGALLQGRSLIFNASARSTNTGATIRTYHWFWGDGSLAQQSSTTNTTHVYAIGNNYTVTLTATDTSSISASRTYVIKVINNLIDLAVDSSVVNQDSGVLPGTIITVSARVLNNGTKTEDANFTISVEGKVIGNTVFHGMTPHSRQDFTAQWNTAGYSPRAYRIDAFVDYVRDPTNHTRIIEDILSNNLLSVFVQLVSPLPGGLSLSLLPSFGVSILVLAGAGFAGSRFLRKKPVDTGPP